MFAESATAPRLISLIINEISIYCEKSAEGASLCLTAGVAQRNLRRRNPTQYIGVEDVEQCCATSRHIFMVALFQQAAPLCGLPAVKHGLPLLWRFLSCHQRIAKILRFLRENSADGIGAQKKQRQPSSRRLPCNQLINKPYLPLVQNRSKTKIIHIN